MTRLPRRSTPRRVSAQFPPPSRRTPGRRGPFPRGARRAPTASPGAAGGGKSAARGLRLAAAPTIPGAGLGRAGLKPSPPGLGFQRRRRRQQRTRRRSLAREPRARGAEGRRGEAAGRRWGGAGGASWEIHQHGAQPPPPPPPRVPATDAAAPLTPSWGLAAHRGPAPPGTDRPARPPLARLRPCEGAAPSAAAASSSSPRPLPPLPPPSHWALEEPPPQLARPPPPPRWTGTTRPPASPTRRRRRRPRPPPPPPAPPPHHPPPPPGPTNPEPRPPPPAAAAAAVAAPASRPGRESGRRGVLAGPEKPGMRLGPSPPCSTPRGFGSAGNPPCSSRCPHPAGRSGC